VPAFLGDRGRELALSVLPLSQVLEGLQPVAGAASLRLAGNLPLGQALAALAAVSGDTPVGVDGAGSGIYAARDLEARILADLHLAASGLASPVAEPQTAFREGHL
jgi:hypothetical protein